MSKTLVAIALTSFGLAACVAMSLIDVRRTAADPGPEGGRHQTIRLGGVTIDRKVEFGQMENSRNERFRVELDNRSDRPIRILGANSSCSKTGCVLFEGLPTTIPAGRVAPLYYVVHARQPGHLDVTSTLYTDLGSHPKLELEVEGEVVAAFAPK